MRVLQVGKFYHPSVGGIETVVRNLSEGLVEHGIQVSVLCYSNEATSYERSTINGVEVIRAPVQINLMSQPISWSYLRTFISICQSFDIIHFHTPNPLVEALSLILKELPPYVVTYHADVVRQKFILPFYRPILQLFLTRASRIFSSSSTLMNHQKILQNHTERCRIVPFGISESSPAQLNSIEALSLKKLEKYGRFCLFVGRLVTYKGLTHLIEAMGQLRHQCPELKLLIIGIGPLFNLLSKLIRDLGLEDRVILMGHVSDETELKSYYKACEFLVLPSISRSEAFGIVLLEAMELSKPVITTHIPTGVIETNQDNVTGLQVDPANSEQLAQAMVKLAENSALRKTLGDNGQRHVHSHFSLQAMLGGTLQVYEELVPTRGQTVLKAA